MEEAHASPPLFYVSEDTVASFVSQEDVTAAITDMFRAYAQGASTNFPVVRESLGVGDAVFGFKSGFDPASDTLGLKAGGLWPGNGARGLPNHQSTTLLFDPTTGMPRALIAAAHLTALRTAAASALSIRVLARRDARVLGLVGAGGQGEWQVLAAVRERAFDRVLVHDRNRESAERLTTRLVAHGVSAVVAETVGELCGVADVIITVTPAREPFIHDADVRPGTHLACMGADTVGKQEVDDTLAARASLFSDEPRQAIALGELQHAYRRGLIGPERIVSLGAVLAGLHPGRRSEAEVTLFDGTGIALQDLVAAEVALRTARSAARAIELPR